MCVCVCVCIKYRVTVLKRWHDQSPDVNIIEQMLIELKEEDIRRIRAILKIYCS